MSERTKTKEQLRTELDSKIVCLKFLVESALKMEKESEARIEMSNTIATNLRSILCGDRSNSFKSLIERTGLNKNLLFPLYDPQQCMNLLTSYNLLGFIFDDKKGVEVAIADSVLKDDNGHWAIYLSFESWMNEVVIDTKLKEVEPLTRHNIIKNIANKIGAHVDDEIERHIFEMSKRDLLPVVFKDGKQIIHDTKLKARTLFCETIIAIAQELITSYKRFKNASFSILGPANYDIRVQRYSSLCVKTDCVKYGTSLVGRAFPSHTYNSNSYYACDIYEKNAGCYVIKCKGKTFKAVIVTYRDVVENGMFVENSIYPLTS